MTVMWFMFGFLCGGVFAIILGDFISFYQGGDI